jgi:hypothetical protein
VVVITGSDRDGQEKLKSGCDEIHVGQVTVEQHKWEGTFVGDITAKGIT